jgi:SAM-dependent methyltransferase
MSSDVLNVTLSLEPAELPQELMAIIICPRCRSPLHAGVDLWVCTNPHCPYARLGFPVVINQPVLVDFEHSIFRREDYEGGRGSVLPRDDTGIGFRTWLRRTVMGDHSSAAPRMIQRLLRAAKQQRSAPSVLVVGGGAIGSGVAALYADPAVQAIGTDVYASPNTKLVADGHALPFRDRVFDAVVVQAVLEHVLEPQRVVDEIHRVLRPDGMVYAETPFMQQVHEGAYDFTRFTRSGHRWLFRRFEEIESGSIGGAGTALLWSIRYFLRALGIGTKATLLMAAPFFWLHLLERFARPRANADAAGGHYFLGKRAEGPTLRAIGMLAYYEQQDQPRPTS